VAHFLRCKHFMGGTYCCDCRERGVDRLEAAAGEASSDEGRGEG